MLEIARHLFEHPRFTISNIRHAFLTQELNERRVGLRASLGVAPGLRRFTVLRDALSLGMADACLNSPGTSASESVANQVVLSEGLRPHQPGERLSADS
jgi:hypothetical protein